MITAAPLIFVFTYPIKEGSLEDYREFNRDFAEFVEAKEPRLIACEVYVNEEGTEATSVLVHPDADSEDFHMHVAGGKLQQDAARTAPAWWLPSAMESPACNQATLCSRRSRTLSSCWSRRPGLMSSPKHHSPGVAYWTPCASREKRRASQSSGSFAPNRQARSPAKCCDVRSWTATGSTISMSGSSAVTHRVRWDELGQVYEQLAEGDPGMVGVTLRWD